MAEDAEIEKAAGVGGGSSKLVPALLIVNVVLVLAVLGVFFFRGGGGTGPADKSTDAKADTKKAESALPRRP